MMKPLSADQHDRALSAGVAVLIFRVAESPACQQFQPELDAFAASHPDCAVWTVEAMEQRDLAERHHLRALPSIVIYRDGLPARRFAGAISAKELAAAVDEVTHADMDEEYNDWMVGTLQTGEAGSPLLAARPVPLQPLDPDSGPAQPERGTAGLSVRTGRLRQLWTSRQHRYHWKPARLGAIPSGAAAHGREADGQPLWVCRAKVFNGLHPGKVRPAFGGAQISWNGGELCVREYEVLMEAGEWRKARLGEIPADASAGGYEATGEELFVARATVADSDLQLGKVRPAFGAANIGYGNRELRIHSYEVLV